MTALETLIAALSDVCAGLLDRRKTARRPGEYTMSDIGLSAFSLFFMGSASFLDYQRRLEEGHGRSNCQTLSLLQKSRAIDANFFDINQPMIETPDLR